MSSSLTSTLFILLPTLVAAGKHSVGISPSGQNNQIDRLNLMNKSPRDAVLPKIRGADTAQIRPITPPMK